MSTAEPQGTASSVRAWRGWRATAAGLLVLAGLAALAGLLSHAYSGSYSRLLADDFCTMGRMRSLGFFGSQLDWYTSWSGRFSFTASTNLVHLLGPMTPRLLPAGVLLLWCAGAAGIVYGQRRTLSKWPGLVATLGGLALPLGALSLAPSIYPVLYWQTGALTYVLPLALACLWGAWLSLDRVGVARADDWVRPALTFIGPAIIAGYSETIGLVFTVMLLLVLARSLIDGQTSAAWKRTWGLAAAGALFGLALVVVAPGNAVRQSLFPTPDPAPVVIGRALQDAYVFSVRLARRYTLPLAWLFTSGLAAAMLVRAKVNKRWPSLLDLLVLPPTAFVLVATVMTPSEYALASFPDDRVLITGTAIVAAAILLWAWRVGAWLAHVLQSTHWLHPAAAAVSAAAATLTLLVAANAISVDQTLLLDARDYARRWDERHQQMTEAVAAGVTSMEVASLTHMGGLAEVERDPQTWINRCIAETYGLRQVRPK